MQHQLLHPRFSVIRCRRDGGSFTWIIMYDKLMEKPLKILQPKCKLFLNILAGDTGIESIDPRNNFMMSLKQEATI